MVGPQIEHFRNPGFRQPRRSVLVLVHSIAQVGSNTREPESRFAKGAAFRMQRAASRLDLSTHAGSGTPSGLLVQRDNRSAMVNVNVPLRNEAVRRFLVAFEGDDDAFRQTLDSEIEWCPIEENRVPLHGVEAAVRNRNAWLDTWDEHRLDVDEVVEEGDDVVALIHLAGLGTGSRARGDVRFYAQVKVRDGKIAYIYDHEDRAAALEAAGVADPSR
jgi:ketosteroid isomerase-like protein